MKRYLTIFPLGLIELFTYILLRRPIKYIGLSNFFGFWAIISLALPIYIFFIKSTQFFNRDVVHYQNVNFVKSPEDMANSTGIIKTSSFKEIVVNKKVYLTFLIYFLINIIAYIITKA